MPSTRRDIHQTLACLALACLFGTLGCSESAKNTLVRGTVSLQGELLDHGAIRFFAADGSRPISGAIHEDGTYEVQLPPSKYQVSISSPPKSPANRDPNDDTPPPPVRNAFPQRYTQVKTSGLGIEVGSQAESKVWDIDLP